MTRIINSTIRLSAVLTIIAVTASLIPALVLGQTRPQNPKQLDAAAVYASVKNTVVMVEAHSKTGSTLQGSGVVFNHDLDTDRKPVSSWIATNAHVVRNAERVIVRQQNQQTMAKVVYIDDEFDLAILYAESKVFPKASIELNSTPSIGEPVFAIGAPLGLEQSITQGIISSIRTKNNATLIQFSAAISSGNSGGGLFDSRARLLGITTFKLKGGENLNFAFDAKHVNDLDVTLFAANLLRRIATSNYANSRKLFSVAEIELINSNHLTKWLLHSKEINGSSNRQTALNLNLEFLQIKSPSSEQAENFLNNLSQILIQFIRYQRPTYPPITESPLSTITILECTQTDERGGRHSDITLYLDITNSTVTGIPAVITDSEVRFPFGKNFIATLNRYTGALRMSTEDAPNFVTGLCTTATQAQKKF
jgi:Trypsin-like peptidase domain